MEGRVLPLLLYAQCHHFSSSGLEIVAANVWSGCQCSLPCCITGTSPSSAIWPRVTGTLAASEDPPCSSPLALTTSSVHRAESQPVNSSIFRIRWSNFLSVCAVLLNHTMVWLDRMLRWGDTGYIQAASAAWEVGAVNPSAPGRSLIWSKLRTKSFPFWYAVIRWMWAEVLSLLASWFLLYLFFCYHISWLFFVCSWPLSGLIQIWPFLLGCMSLYCSLFWNVTRLDFWIGSSHAAFHFFHNEKKKKDSLSAVHL